MKHANVKRISQFITIVFVVASLGLDMPARLLAASPQSPAAATDYTCTYYIVKRGDTLIKIGNRYGFSYRTLMTVNNLRTTRIYIGQRLCIPNYNPPPPSSGPWYAQFWNNTTQSGTPALVRNDAAIDFNWGFGTPSPSRVFADNFSAMWTRNVDFIGGTYRFTLNADDGIRLWVDGNVVFDNYNFAGYQANQVDVGITAGVHALRVDYVELSGLARVRATYYRLGGGLPPPPPCSNCPPPSTNGPWHGDFFNNTSLAGAPVFSTDTNGLNFDWGYGSPSASVPVDNFSARFTQYRYLSAGIYRFVAQSDDGVRVWVDDRPVINQWVQQSARTVTGDITVGAGNHLVRVEYFELTGLAVLQVYWEFLGNPNP